MRSSSGRRTIQGLERVGWRKHAVSRSLGQVARVAAVRKAAPPPIVPTRAPFPSLPVTPPTQVAMTTPTETTTTTAPAEAWTPPRLVEMAQLLHLSVRQKPLSFDDLFTRACTVERHEQQFGATRSDLNQKGEKRRD